MTHQDSSGLKSAGLVWMLLLNCLGGNFTFPPLFGALSCSSWNFIWWSESDLSWSCWEKCVHASLWWTVTAVWGRGRLPIVSIDWGLNHKGSRRVWPASPSLSLCITAAGSCPLRRRKLQSSSITTERIMNTLNRKTHFISLQWPTAAV